MGGLVDTEDHVERFILHRGTMRLVDRLVEADDEHAVVQAQVPHEGLFVHDGQMPAYVVIEHMAQSIAAWAGARARRAGGAPSLGFLLGTRRMALECESLPAGAQLTVHVRCELLVGNGLGMFDCEVLHHGQRVAQAQVSVFEPPDAEAYLNGATTTS
jgi:predicted hotdog family 3-hydroxylacyl-ACP dehydratase